MKIVKWSFIFLSLFGLNLIGFSQNKFIHRVGKTIVDSTGQPIQLRGIHLGGWLDWEGWIYGGGFGSDLKYNGSETYMMTALSRLVGSSGADQFMQQMHEQFITSEDIAAISQSCYNVVRIPINHRLLEDDSAPYVYKQSGWKILDSLISWCEKYHVYVIPDLHATPGGQNNYFFSDPDKDSSFWIGKNNQLRTIKLWGAIADRYKNKTIIAGFDLLNESDTPWFHEWKVPYISEKIIQEIRTVDANHLMIVEGDDLATNFSAFSGLLDANMAFSMHVYTFIGNADPKAVVASYNSLIDQYNVPLWNGEWGEHNYATLDATRKALEDPANQLSGWAFCTWKKVINHYPCLNEIQITPKWTKVAKWITDTVGNPRPTLSETNQGISEFFNSIKYENTVRDQQMHSILSPCSITTSINNNLDSNEPTVTIFPNPANDHISVTINLEDEKVIEIKIIDVLGKNILSVPAQNYFDASHPLIIPVHDLPAGTYFLKLSTETLVISRPISVIK
ncbi:MAG: cellulase family glycosylhydrolase [Bacteroidota bacterium]